MISTGPLLDALGTAALENKELILQRTNAILDKNRSFLKEWLKDQDIFDCVIPENGTVCFFGNQRDDRQRENSAIFIKGARHLFCARRLF